jgi:hypothetical protein
VNLWGKKFAYFWSTDAMLLSHYFPDKAYTKLGPRLRAIGVGWMLVVAIPYMLLIGFGISGFYLVREFDSRGLYLLQLFFGTLLTFASYGLARYHFPLVPAAIVGVGAVWRPKVWNSNPPWRRLVLLFTLGMLGGIWLFEAMTIAGV